MNRLASKQGVPNLLSCYLSIFFLSHRGQANLLTDNKNISGILHGNRSKDKKGYLQISVIYEEM